MARDGRAHSIRKVSWLPSLVTFMVDKSQVFYNALRIKSNVQMSLSTLGAIVGWRSRVTLRFLFRMIRFSFMLQYVQYTCLKFSS